MAASPLVDTDWLYAHLGAPDIRTIDASWFMPDEGRNAAQEFEKAHIPGSAYFDIDDIADDSSDLPHMVPSAAKFSSRVRRMGLGDGVKIVVYDNNRFFASARVWWMFRLFGHDDVVVLDGGLSKWRSENKPVEDELAQIRERHFTTRQNNFLLRELDQIRQIVTNKGEQIVDTRSAPRFKAEVEEPRQGLRAGHIPGSFNLHYGELLQDDGTLAPAGKLQRAFAEAGVDLTRPVVTSCGSGVSAAVASLALAVLGRYDVPLYDGSWTEWGSRTDTPIST